MLPDGFFLFMFFYFIIIILYCIVLYTLHVCFLFLCFYSIRDDSVVESYVDCEWTGTNILKRDSLDIPTDSDLIIGYLFSVSVIY